MAEQNYQTYRQADAFIVYGYNSMNINLSKLTRFVPVFFVFLWSTGFIGAKYSLPYIETFNLLFIRMLATIAVFSLLMILFKIKLPPRSHIKHQVISGLLIHGAYLGGVFAAIKWQMPAGLTALLVSMQPLLTALLTITISKQSLRLHQWFGLFIGLFGVILVLLSKEQAQNYQLSWPMIAATMTALFGITLGSIYQKRYGGETNLLAASLIQYIATAILMGVLTFSFETQTIDWKFPLIAGLLWLIFGISVVAILLLLFMIKQGESAKVSAYFYLVPGLTAIEAWILFDETLSLLAIAGVGLSIFGVYLTIKQSNVSSRTHCTACSQK